MKVIDNVEPTLLLLLTFKKVTFDCRMDGEKGGLVPAACTSAVPKHF